MQNYFLNCDILLRNKNYIQWGLVIGLKRWPIITMGVSLLDPTRYRAVILSRYRARPNNETLVFTKIAMDIKDCLCGKLVLQTKSRNQNLL